MKEGEKTLQREKEAEEQRWRWRRAEWRWRVIWTIVKSYGGVEQFTRVRISSLLNNPTLIPQPMVEQRAFEMSESSESPVLPNLRRQLRNRSSSEEESSLQEDNTSGPSKAKESSVDEDSTSAKSSGKEDIASSQELPESSQLQKPTLMDHVDEDEWKPPAMSTFGPHPPPPDHVEGWEPTPCDYDYTIGGIPGMPCVVCDSTEHFGCGCPYLYSYPPNGPKINSADYDIVCKCGNTNIIPDHQSCADCIPYTGFRVQPKRRPPLLEYDCPGYDCPGSPSAYPKYDFTGSPSAHPQYDIPGSYCSYPEYYPSEDLKIQY